MQWGWKGLGIIKGIIENASHEQLERLWLNEMKNNWSNQRNLKHNFMSFNEWIIKSKAWWLNIHTMIQYLQLACQPVPPSSPLLSVRNKILVINTKNVVFILIMNDVHIQPLNENSKANQANYEYCFTKGKKNDRRWHKWWYRSFGIWKREKKKYTK